MFIFSTGLFFFVAVEGQKDEEKKSDSRTADLKRQDKEIQRFKSRTPADCLGLNNGTAWKSQLDRGQSA